MGDNHRAYIYTRVSTAMQVEGYSLDAQKASAERYALANGIAICGTFSDEGKSGKNVKTRTEFIRMIDTIENGNPDKVDFVIVFKLSRFGRSAADVLIYLQRMQDCGVNLICVEDGLDSSKSMGSMMVKIISIVAELERENILVQTMEGRNQKAREGKWNGGSAPYGYKLENGELVVVPEEADAVRKIFELYLNENIGANGVAKYLTRNGIKKAVKQKHGLTQFSSCAVKDILDNPVYYGKIAYGRTRTVKKTGAGVRNETTRRNSDNYILVDGHHEPLITEEDWNKAHEKRLKSSKVKEKTYSLEHEHALSGILHCPECGGSMYGNVNRKKRKDGTLYRDYWFYRCKNLRIETGHRCTYYKQWSQDIINDAVAEFLVKCTQSEDFAQRLSEVLDSSTDTTNLNKQIEEYKKHRAQTHGAQKKLHEQMDSLSIADPHYNRKYADYMERDERFYTALDEIDEEIEKLTLRIEALKKNRLNKDGLYEALKQMGDIYPQMTYAEKKEFFQVFVERVDIFETQQPSGQILRHIKLRLPLIYNGDLTDEIGWDKEGHVETVIRLSRQ